MENFGKDRILKINNKLDLDSSIKTRINNRTMFTLPSMLYLSCCRFSQPTRVTGSFSSARV